ncbi:NAD-dependent epimerase/dehydratase family protein [Bogoriella caseilytica]|uniref:Nucleoside-diphosphate-sugar epimerase n=1 Tax=Bogoriella caseilytica TaxID=56055 RepID=A0A3N2BBG3_9MICO|nr:NAD(P)-dependent oxidoreductase [Bogoriella caseilytica]ROR72414.1 nucleoside-diphosphate-sugar epimerase [Bogoriella caseilytica]
MKVAITGSSGTLGRTVVDHLRAQGEEVIGLDRTGPSGPGFTTVDLGDYGQTLDALHGITARHTGVDALVHLAAIPVNGLVPDATTFHRNMVATFNVFFAALRVGIRRIVYASSITAMGFPFTEPPPYLPLDENHTASFNTYGLVKVLEETMARELVSWDPTLSVTALRFTNVVAPGEYATFARAAEPGYRRDLLGTYIDARDGAQAVTLALAETRPGFEVYAIAAPESGNDRPSAELAESWFPGVPLRRELGEYEALIDTTKAREQLGFRAEFSWREEYRG